MEERARKLGGDLRIQSTPGTGTQVFVELPSERKKHDAAAVKVLLVEDHFMARLALRSILGDSPALSIVGEADNGHEAVRLYTKLLPDVTVMDLNLPGLEDLTRSPQFDGRTAPRR